MKKHICNLIYLVGRYYGGRAARLNRSYPFSGELRLNFRLIALTFLSSGREGCFNQVENLPPW